MREPGATVCYSRKCRPSRLWAAKYEFAGRECRLDWMRCDGWPGLRSNNGPNNTVDTTLLSLPPFPVGAGPWTMPPYPIAWVVRLSTADSVHNIQRRRKVAGCASLGLAHPSVLSWKKSKDIPRFMKHVKISPFAAAGSQSRPVFLFPCLPAAPPAYQLIAVDDVAHSAPLRPAKTRGSMNVSRPNPHLCVLHGICEHGIYIWYVSPRSLHIATLHHS